MPEIRGWAEISLNALCATRPHEMYDLDTVPVKKWNHQALKAYAEGACQGCPIVRECLHDALNHDTRGVIRGGRVWGDSATTATKVRREVATLLGVDDPRAQTRKSRCGAGHEMTPENESADSDGRIRCRECRRVQWRQAKARQRAKAEAA